MMFRYELNRDPTEESTSASRKRKEPLEIILPHCQQQALRLTGQRFNKVLFLSLG
jgi:hypothetical protein